MLSITELIPSSFMLWWLYLVNIRLISCCLCSSFSYLILLFHTYAGGLHMVSFPVVALARGYCFIWRWYRTSFLAVLLTVLLVVDNMWSLC
jgi:hypothetical protein